jgi:hypothetical protein
MELLWWGRVGLPTFGPFATSYNPAQNPVCPCQILSFSMSGSRGRLPCGHCGWESQNSLVCEFSNLPDCSVLKLTCPHEFQKYDLCQQRPGALFWKISTGKWGHQHRTFPFPSNFSLLSLPQVKASPSPRASCSCPLLHTAARYLKASRALRLLLVFKNPENLSLDQEALSQDGTLLQLSEV